MTKLHASVSVIMLALGCGGGEGGAGSDIQGVASYRDATTDASGSPVTPATPPAQTARLSVAIRGTGTVSGLDPTCLDQASGQFQALYTSDAALDGAGGYAAALAAARARIETPSGCEIPELAVGVITDVVVRAELDATTANCDSYCAASARADAEAACAAEVDRAACWSQAEASARASCQTTCTTSSSRIVAEATVGAGTLGQVDADALRAAAFGSIDVDLELDQLE